MHHPRKIAGRLADHHAARYLHPNQTAVADAGELLSNYLRGSRAPRPRSTS